MKSCFQVKVLCLLLCYSFEITTVFAQPQQQRVESAASYLPIQFTEGKYMALVPDSLLGRDLLVVTRVAKGFSNEKQTILAGEKVNDKWMRFERDADKILLLAVTANLRSTDNSANGMSQSVANSNQQAVDFAFEPKSIDGSPRGNLIDITAFLKDESDLVVMNQAMKESWDIASFQQDKSEILEVHSYKTKVFIKSRRTYSTKSGGNITIELGTTVLLLSKDPMHARYNDTRVGYFTTPAFTEFNAGQQGSERNKFITRWRLEPKPGDIEKYKRGELVEPQKPIVFYLDPAIPQKWIPYFIKGVSDWQAAFEKAGFKNAIYARAAPTKEEDPAWSLGNSAYSNIVYMASDNEDASYSTIVDPRSGEILESHIRWYNDIMKVLHKWYFVQASPNDPRARKLEFEDELMGELIRYVMSHEIGHALGFPHNFISSYSTPVELLRNKKWVEANGHTVSIMDYARFNYVAQPGDKIGPKGLFPRIGDYDKWAIEWGYRWLPSTQNREEEIEILQKLIASKMKDKHYWYGGEGLNDDPRSQNEDVGSDAIIANKYGIKNLQYIIANLTEWTKGAGNEILKKRYDDVYYQFLTYLGHVADNIGGIYETPEPTLKEKIIYQPVPKAIQQKALRFLNEQLFITPSWILNKDIFTRTGDNAIEKLNGLQSRTLYAIMSAKRIGNLIKAAAADSINAYSPKAYFDDLDKLIFKEAYDHRATDAYRRNLQNNYVDFFERLVKLPANNRLRNPEQGDIPLLVRSAASNLKAKLTIATPKVKDELTQLHWKQVMTRLDNIINQQK